MSHAGTPNEIIEGKAQEVKTPNLSGNE
ncbi:hypothetical protein CCACVL1_00410 [Corchorus capsularis]|uniref:Uncharacterized protein n=1 Tax=Corchorus capsularis TaxID=210143 RepID=A0A1R3KX62_COCAP|nr:hypothetical protein CCACVL1_00410 [Corchorus capsularis]